MVPVVITIVYISELTPLDIFCILQLINNLVNVGPGMWLLSTSVFFFLRDLDGLAVKSLAEVILVYEGRIVDL